MRKLIYCLLATPLVFTVAFFLYIGVTNDPGCGSADPGPCFGAGVLMMVVAPLSVITIPILIILLVRDWLKARKR